MAEEHITRPAVHSDGDTREARSGEALRGGGALEFIAHVTENPTVVATVASTVATTAGVTAKHFLDKLNEPPPPPDPPHSGLWVPNADE